MKKHAHSMFRLAGLIAVVVLGLGLRPTTPVPQRTDTSSPDGGRYINITWRDVFSCEQMKFYARITYLQETIDCNDPISEYRPEIICVPFDASTPPIFVPGAGTILTVEFMCGQGCTGPSTLVYECEGHREEMTCCDAWAYGYEDPSGDIQVFLFP